MRKKYSLPHLFGCLLAAQMLTVSAAYAQNSYSYARNNTVTHKNSSGSAVQDSGSEKARLFTVLKELNKQKGVYFLFSEQSLANQLVKPLGDTKASTEKILDDVLLNTGIKYKKINERTYVILSDKDKRKTSLNFISVEGIEMTSPLILDQVTIADPITGKVVGPDGKPIANATVSVKGTVKGTATDANGLFTIQAKRGDVLVISYIGHTTREITINNDDAINVSLVVNNQQMTEVVVTALGIQKRTKSLTYATQQVQGDELTRAKDPNMMNALAGKAAGVTINKSASGLGGSVKVLIRGSRSINGNNQPLYVIDGMPISNTNSEQPATTIGGTNDAGGRDAGDGISNLNPDDIETMNVLKGPAAAALYGTQAANGVVVITTKKGKAGRTAINFNSNTIFETPALLPKFQNSYGSVAEDGTVAATSWGKAINGSDDYVKDFFQTGITAINSVSLSSGNDKNQTYLSYANTTAKGIIEGNKFYKNNLNFRQTSYFFNDALKVDGNVNLIAQNVKNRPTPGGFYINPLVGLYHFPRGGNISLYRDHYEKFDTTRNMMLQNWYNGYSDMDQNPYWLTNKTPAEDKRNRAIANLALSYKLGDHFTLQTRGIYDFISDDYNQKMYAGTHPSLADNNGRYITFTNRENNIYGDVILSYTQRFKSDISISAVAGASITDTRAKNLRLDSRPGDLVYANIFTVPNMNLNGGYIVENNIHKQMQSVFAMAQVGLKDFLFLDVSGRNDWSSTLAFTESLHKGFFYPSIGLTAVLSDMFKMPGWISFGKIRGAWSQVGNDLAPYVSNNTAQTINAGGVKMDISSAPFSELKPEQTRSIEVGTEWRFFNNRLGIDVTYYKTNTRNQLFRISSAPSARYPFYYVNGGNIQNQGMEVMLSATPVSGKDFQWKTNVNYAFNKNEVLEMPADIPVFYFGEKGSNNYQMRLEKGGSIGDIYGLPFQRDAHGDIETNAEGIPLKSSGDWVKLANSAPKFNLGWANTFTCKQLALYVLFDGRFGGKVISLTQADLDLEGVSKVTGDARNTEYVTFEGKQIDDVKGFYDMVGGRSGITEYYVYDATIARLRELSISYSIPSHVFNNKVVKGIDFALTGRNLFYLTKKAPFDTDASLSTGNDLQGVDVFGMPATRTFGFNIKLLL